MDNKENNSPLSGERVEKVQNAIIENQLDITKWNVSPNSTMRSMIKACMNEYSDFRIAELEAENAKLREALENLYELTKGWGSNDIFIHKVILEQAEQALKGKEAKDE